MAFQPLYSRIGHRIRQARRARSLTQAQLAERVGLQRTSITNIESGVQHVQVHVLFELANAVGVKVADLLPESFGGDGGAQSDPLRDLPTERRTAVLDILKEVSIGASSPQPHRTRRSKR